MSWLRPNPDAKVPLRSPGAAGRFGALGLDHDNRLTQSWHMGQQEIVEPKWPVSRSFADGCDRTARSGRAAGGIERRPKPTLPTPEQRCQLASFADTYQGIHHQKPHVVAFVNSKSGGQTGQLLMKALTESIGRQEGGDLAFTGEVCDLSSAMEPAATIESLAEGLQRHAQRRLLICGGDGTVTWILTALAECKSLEGKHHLLPAAIVPLGTGNDLARSLGWGSSLRAVSDVLDYLQWVIEATPVTLDQWRLVLRPHEPLEEGHKLRRQGSHPQLISDRETATRLQARLDEALGMEASQAQGPGEVYVGFWQNYYSLGMDAKVAAYVDDSRNHSVGRAFFRWGLGKACYVWQGLRRSCCTRLIPSQLRRLRLAGAEDADDASPASARSFRLADLPIQGRPGRLRQMVMLNINSYAAGLNVLPRADEASRRPSPSDGVLEVLAVRNAFSSLLNFIRLAKPQYLASARQVAFQHATGEWMQLDGEPWRLEAGCDALVEPHRKLAMLCAPPSAPFWRGHISQEYWAEAAPPLELQGGA